MSTSNREWPWTVTAAIIALVLVLFWIPAGVLFASMFGAKLGISMLVILAFIGSVSVYGLAAKR